METPPGRIRRVPNVGPLPSAATMPVQANNHSVIYPVCPFGVGGLFCGSLPGARKFRIIVRLILTISVPPKGISWFGPKGAAGKGGRE